VYFKFFEATHILHLAFFTSQEYYKQEHIKNRFFVGNLIAQEPTTEKRFLTSNAIAHDFLQKKDEQSYIPVKINCSTGF